MGWLKVHPMNLKYSKIHWRYIYHVAGNDIIGNSVQNLSSTQDRFSLFIYSLNELNFLLHFGLPVLIKSVNDLYIEGLICLSKVLKTLSLPIETSCLLNLFVDQCGSKSHQQDESRSRRRYLIVRIQERQATNRLSNRKVAREILGLLFYLKAFFQQNCVIILSLLQKNSTFASRLLRNKA